MKPFEYATPNTLEEATELLGTAWGETEILAGGTDLVTSLKQKIIAPRRVVSLRNIKELSGIKTESQAVRIGAITTLADVLRDKSIQQNFPALITAIKGIGSPQILNAGTAGGDLCQRPRCWYYRNGLGLFGKDQETSLVRQGDNRYHAIFNTDGDALFVSPSSLGPVLIALDAALTVVGPKEKKRSVQAAQFFQTPKSEKDRETVLQPNEILAEIQVPLKGRKNATYEVRHRHGFDWPYVTATVTFQINAGKSSNSRVVLGHVASVPWPAGHASNVLDGAAIDETLAVKCGEAAAQGAKPLSGNGYKVQLVKTAVKRAVLAAAGMTKEA